VTVETDTVVIFQKSNISGNINDGLGITVNQCGFQWEHACSACAVSTASKTLQATLVIDHFLYVTDLAKSGQKFNVNHQQ